MPAEGGCARRTPWREGKCVGLTLASVSRARDPRTRPTRARHPFASAAPGGESARAPRCAPGGRGTEGERGEEDPAFSSSSLPGQRPAGSGSSFPRRHRHRPGPGPAVATRPEPLSARSSRGSKAGLSNSQLFFVTFLRCIIPGLSCFITKNPRETTRQDQSDAGSQTVFLYFIKV